MSFLSFFFAAGLILTILWLIAMLLLHPVEWKTSLLVNMMFLIIAVARTEGSSARSTPSLPARFRVRASDTNFIIIGGVAGSVGVVILIAVGIFVGAFFLCFYSHR